MADATDRDQIRAALHDPCAHGAPPCVSCQEGRLGALVMALGRLRVDALRRIRTMVEANEPPGLIVQAVDAAVLAEPRDTAFDTAVVLLSKTHGALRRTTRPRPDPGLLAEVAAFLSVAGVDVSTEVSS